MALEFPSPIGLASIGFIVCNVIKFQSNERHTFAIDIRSWFPLHVFPSISIFVDIIRTIGSDRVSEPRMENQLLIGN